MSFLRTLPARDSAINTDRMKHFLTRAVEALQPKPIYYTPKKVTDSILMNLIIGNPPIK